MFVWFASRTECLVSRLGYWSMSCLVAGVAACVSCVYVCASECMRWSSAIVSERGSCRCGCVSEGACLVLLFVAGAGGSGGSGAAVRSSVGWSGARRGLAGSPAGLVMTSDAALHNNRCLGSGPLHLHAAAMTAHTGPPVNYRSPILSFLSSLLSPLSSLLSPLS